MSGAPSRRVKNPLLSAAGDGFSFENYAENALLVPVTPATPAVLRDDPELDNFIGQDSASTAQFPNLPVSQAGTNIELSPATQFQEEAKNLSAAPPKQGYFTSILSSLPNLSLSSITGDTSSSPANQGLGNKTPYVSPSDPRGALTDPSQHFTVNPQEAPNFSGLPEVNRGLAPPFSTPPQPTLPPTAPLNSDGTVSYRLGNQRRLKYAPPPDLKTNTSKQYPSPAVQTFFSPPNPSGTPTIFNPNESIAPTQNYHPIEPPQPASSQPSQYPGYDQFSQNSSLQGSFRSSPVAVGAAYSSGATPRSITPQSQPAYYEPSNPALGKPRISLSCTRPIPIHAQEPATPQNTPANVSFPGFDLYLNQRNFSATPNSEGEVPGIKEPQKLASQSQTARDNTPGSAGEIRAGVSQPTALNTTFAPISAVKVTEKLEHLLAEQNDRSTESSIASQSVKTVVSQPVDSSQTVRSEHLTKSSSLDKKETLSEIDLGQNSSQDTELPEKTSSSIEYTKSAEVPSTVAPVQSLQSSQETLSVFSSPQNFFADNQPAAKLNLGYPPTIEPAVGPNFFAEPTKSSLNYTPKVESFGAGNYTNTSKAFEVHTSASSFFDSTEHSETFTSFTPTDNKANAHVAPTSAEPQSHTGLQVTSTSADSTIPVPQSLWNTNPIAQAENFNLPRNQAASQAPPPLFYDPTQFAAANYKQPAVQNSFVPLTPQPVKQTHQYLNNYSGSQQVFGAPSTHASVFSPISPPSIATVIPEPTGTATLNPIQVSINPLSGRHSPDTVPPSLQNLAAGPTDRRMQYRPVYHHWFYRKEVENKVLWHPFSMHDSLNLEDVHNSSEITPESLVATDGGRYDVDILRRQRTPVYWVGPATEVRRCSWFHKGATESRYIPYDESTSMKLEGEFKQACQSNIWNRKIELSNGEYIIFHNATVQAHYSQPTTPELAATWGNSTGSEDSTYLQGTASRPRVIKRGHDEFHIEDGEPEQVDHLLFLVHGIGSVCDLKFRTVEEVVDEFRSISLQLVQSHYRTASEQRIVNRIEVLPISWHTTLHSEDTGIDKKLKSITLESIPKLRHFTNDTLLDILFYTSPIYCQTIMQTVGGELNRLYTLFRERNPSFDGGIYLGGHSLGSLILFDLLCHQKPPANKEAEEAEKEQGDNEKDKDTENADKDMNTLPAPVLKRRLSKRVSYVMGAAGTGQPFIHYPQLNFHPRAFFALGSPIGMFVTVRGIDTLGDNFLLPTCPAFFNIFHPFDPVAYRVESLIDPDAHKYRPMLIPHHKGRKRMHLELKETMARVGADLKQKLIDSVRNTWNSVYQLALFHKPDPQALEEEIDKVVEEQLQKPPTLPDQQSQDDGADIRVGMLNGGRRIDYVLQEAPFEYINEYIFALTSHVGYWESEDTMLMMLKEIYGSEGIQADAQLPPQTLTVERPTSSLSSPVVSPTSYSQSDLSVPVPSIGMDPTAPISEKSIGPPPKIGFIRKS